MNQFVKTRHKENSHTLLTENDIISRVFDHYGKTDVEFNKLQMSWSAEGVITKKRDKTPFSEILAWVEIKTRKSYSYSFPDYSLSWKKYCNMMQLSNNAVNPKPALLYVAFLDGIFEVRLKPNCYDPIYFHNNCVQEAEPAIKIPIGKFKFICKGREEGYFSK